MSCSCDTPAPDFPDCPGQRWYGATIQANGTAWAWTLQVPPNDYRRIVGIIISAAVTGMDLGMKDERSCLLNGVTTTEPVFLTGMDIPFCGRNFTATAVVATGATIGVSLLLSA